MRLLPVVLLVLSLFLSARCMFREPEDMSFMTSSFKVPMAGNPQGDVIVSAYLDYNCSYCMDLTSTLEHLASSDGGIKLMYREYPILGDASVTAAKWALAADMQGKYARFHRALMTRTAPLGRNFLEETARDSGMDVEKARADAESKAVADQIKYNRVTGLSKGIRGTPAILVGNKLVQGAVEFERLRQMVAEARSAR